MWQANYKFIDRNGVRPEIKVCVVFTSGKESFESIYDILPEDFKSQAFSDLIQSQLDILNNKDAIISAVNFVPDEDATKP